MSFSLFSEIGPIMKLKINIWLSVCAILVLGIVGCNIFNPTESVNVAPDDADALTYEGYIKFRDNKYAEAAEYFKRAIHADSSHSEAWYGLAKAKLNLQDINIFEILKYINIGQDKTLPIANMTDEIAFKYQVGIDTVLFYLNRFIYQDTTGKLDGVITYKTIANSYMILEMMQTILILRKTTNALGTCKGVLNGNASDCDMNIVLNSLKGNTEGTLEAFHSIFKTCEDNPQSMATVADQYIQNFDWIAKDKQGEAVGTLCGAMSYSTGNLGDSSSRERALDAVISQMGYSDASDDDGDGCIDEEIYDGEDNDGDGEIDEDLRDNTPKIIHDATRAAKNMLKGKKNVRDLMIVTSASPNEKYMTIDIDKNGLFADDEEWEFVYADYDKRLSNANGLHPTGNHLLKFAKKLVYNPQNLPFDEYLAVKHAVAADLNGKYNLEYRKKYIGGCWVNYDENAFQQWLNRRK